jgi:hypothetical protein
MDKLLAGPFGLIAVIALAVFFLYVLRGLFDTVSEDGAGPTRRTRRPRRAAASGPRARRETSWEGTRGWSRAGFTLETFQDFDSGAMSGRVISGPFSGSRLEDLSRPELMRLYGHCRAEDPEAAGFVAAYMRRRFAGDGPREEKRDGGRRWERAAPPPAADGPMTREGAYAALGLPAGASDGEIHRAYRALIMKHHPDHGGTHAKAAEINQAKDMLLG